MDATKYRAGYFPVDKKYNKWVEKDHIEKAPIRCSVDMREGGILVGCKKCGEIICENLGKG